MKLAVFYHIALVAPINKVFGLSLFSEQMRLLEASGLAAEASYIKIGLNGTDEDAKAIAELVPAVPGISPISTHANGRSELPTLSKLQQWLPGHEDWAVCYFHAKGITHAGDEHCGAWRRCMEGIVIRNWRRCVRDLEGPADSVGAHWLTREQYGPLVNTFFWGGNFWWTKASFLAKLPPIRPNSECRDHDFEAETWIGTGPRPKVRDYAPHWPECGHGTCLKPASACYLLR